MRKQILSRGDAAIMIWKLLKVFAAESVKISPPRLRSDSQFAYTIDTRKQFCGNGRVIQTP